MVNELKQRVKRRETFGLSIKGKLGRAKVFLSNKTVTQTWKTPSP